MKMKKIMILVAIASTWIACNNDEEMWAEDNRDPNVIYLSAGVEGVSNAVTRALSISDFPNYKSTGTQIAVVAKYNTLANNWTSPYINHQPAAVSAGSSAYNFTWDTPQYWPISGETLQFIAYGPVTSASNSTMVLDASNRAKMTITLPSSNANMPDIIVANKTLSGTTEVDITGRKVSSATSDGKQEPTTINFLFKHILSELNVKVKGSNISTSNSAYVSKVQVIVGANATKKTFDMTQSVSVGATNGWASVSGSSITYTYTGSTSWALNDMNSIYTVNGSRPILLFPDTQAYVTARVFVKDNSSATETQLKDIVLGNISNAVLAQGKLTTLEITVQGTLISGLTGSVTGWVDAGTFKATIL